jgi:hypothetical protein
VLRSAGRTVSTRDLPLDRRKSKAAGTPSSCARRPLLIDDWRDSGRAGDKLDFMKVLTYEAIVQRGEVKLSETVTLPEHAKVYVVVPGDEDLPTSRIQTPRLLRSEQVSDFAMEIVEGENATVR